MSSLIESPETRQGVRVRLSGRVASRPNLLAKNRFVLVNDDGRGLLVHANGKQPSPGIGRMVELTGTVYWNDDGLWLKQGTADRWNDTAKDEAPPTSTLPVRAADLVAPAAEDAWSRLRLEGKVGSVQKASFDLETDETSIRIRVPAKLGYRVQRLQRGDLVSVEGLLDLRGGDPVVIPQREEEIQVIQRFSPPPEPKNPPIERPWLPVGAAGGTLALSEGWRRLKERQKRLREDAAFRALLEKTGTA